MDTTGVHNDRRKHPRFTLKAYGLHHHCVVHRSGLETNVQLIDITPAGARLRYADSDTPPSSGEMVVVDLRMEQLTPAGLGLDSRVQWKDGMECGVQFLQELECGVSDLQRILDEAPIH